MAAQQIFSDIEIPALGSGKKKPSIGLDIPESSLAIADSLSRDANEGIFSTEALQEVNRTSGGSGSAVSIPSRKVDKQFENEGLDRAATQSRRDAATGIGLGLQLGSQQTGNTDLVSADSLIQVLGGAGLGGLTGGPVGAVAGGLAAGIGVFLSTRSEKKKQKSQRAKEDRYQKMVKEQLAREDKFRRQARLDDLEQLGFDRRANKLQNQQTQYKELTANILRMVNSNAKLKQRFVQQGF